MEIEEKLSRRITRALERLGVPVSEVRISNYNAEFFGNHIADVETNAGPIRVVFDRQYEVDLLDSTIPQDHAAQMQRVLNDEWSADARADL